MARSIAPALLWPGSVATWLASLQPARMATPRSKARRPFVCRIVRLHEVASRDRLPAREAQTSWLASPEPPMWGVFLSRERAANADKREPNDQVTPRREWVTRFPVADQLDIVRGTSRLARPLRSHDWPYNCWPHSWSRRRRCRRSRLSPPLRASRSRVRWPMHR